MVDKKQILLQNKWELLEGYCFPSPCADEGQLTFVEKADAEKVFAEGAKEYFWHDAYEEIFTLEEAWEYFLESYYDENGVEYDESTS